MLQRVLYCIIGKSEKFGNRRNTIDMNVFCTLNLQWEFHHLHSILVQLSSYRKTYFFFFQIFNDSRYCCYRTTRYDDPSIWCCAVSVTNSDPVISDAYVFRRYFSSVMNKQTNKMLSLASCIDRRPQSQYCGAVREYVLCAFVD